MKNPFLGSMVAKAAIDGIQGDDMSNHGNLVVCAKHYMGYCASDGGRDYQTTQITDYSLRNTYLKAFEAAVKMMLLLIASAVRLWVNVYIN